MATRDESERALEALIETYPKTFFKSPPQRRPLKPNIVNDILKDIAANPDSELKYENIEDAIDWYQSHLGYQMALSVAGASQIDLKGNVVGKVTVNGAYNAQQRVKEIREEMKSRWSTNGTRWVAPASPPPRAITVTPPASPAADTTMDLEQLSASIDTHVKNAKMLLQNDFEPKLRPMMLRPVLELLASEIKLLQPIHC
jgi:sRNA-binding protein